MRGKTPDPVHRLIHGMSAAEKRYFKIHLGRYPTTSRCGHAALFDDMATTEPDDGARLASRYRARGSTTPFALAKRRLFDAVLESLCDFHAQHNVDARLRRMLEQVSMLHDRALQGEAEKLLKHASRLAEKHQRSGVLLDILRWEKRLMERRNYTDLKETALIAHEERAGRLLNDLATVDRLWVLKSKALLALYRSGQARHAADRSELGALADEAVRITAVHDGGTQGRYLRAHLLGIIAFALGDLRHCHTHLCENLALLREERDRSLDEPHLLLAVLGNLAWVCERLGRMDEARAHLQAFRKAPAELGMPETEDLERKLFAMSFSLELAMHLREGDFTAALELEPVVCRGLDQHDNALGAVRRAAFHFQLMHACFGAGELDRAQRWCHRLIQEAPPAECGETLAFARMMLLMIKWDRGHTGDIPHLLRNIERQLHGQGRTHRFEQALFQLFHDLLRTRGHGHGMDAFRNFHEQVVALENDPMERSVFDHFDPVAWAASHLTGKPYSTLVKERCDTLDRAA